MLQSRDRLRRVQIHPGKEEGGLSELLKLQQTVKDKIHQSESILNLSRSFHLAANQVRGAENLKHLVSQNLSTAELWVEKQVGLMFNHQIPDVSNSLVKRSSIVQGSIEIRTIQIHLRSY